MSNKLIEIVKECYPSDIIDDVDFHKGQLRILSGDKIRWYGFVGDKLYCYTPEEIDDDTHISKFKKIFREIKINQIIE